MLKDKSDDHAYGKGSEKAQSGELFVDGVSPKDVAQGSIGDCYLAAALGAIAASKPEAIEEAISKVGPRTWSVRFYKRIYGGKYAVQKVAVDADLPKKAAGSLAYAKGPHAGPARGRELWPSLVEKAFAKWKGGYDDIGGGGLPGRVMEALLGEEYDSTYTAWTPEDKLWQKILEVGKGKPMSAYTHNDDKAYFDKKDKVVANHAYIVLGGEEEGGERTVRCRNPWSAGKEIQWKPRKAKYGKRAIWGADFELPLSEFKRIFQGYDQV